MPLKSNPKGEAAVTSKLWQCNLDPSDYNKNKATSVSLIREDGRRKGVMEVYQKEK